MHALEHGLDAVEVFVFGTRLTRITRELRKRNVDDAIEHVVKSVDDWSGGTRIGEAIKTFNYKWARRVLRSGATVVMISDGWDRGDPQLLSREMARLQRSSRRLIWLNPLLGGARLSAVDAGHSRRVAFRRRVLADSQSEKPGGAGADPRRGRKPGSDPAPKRGFRCRGSEIAWDS